MSSLTAGPVLAAGQGTVRRLSDWLDDEVNLEANGGTPDGVTDNATAISTAKALAGSAPIYVPRGTFYRAGSNFGAAMGSIRVCGPGRIKTGTNTQAPFFSVVNAAPSSYGTHSSIDTAFNGDISRVQFAVGQQITGTATLGQPSTGYLYRPECYPHYTYLYNSSGWNQSTSTNDGRTAACAFRVNAGQYGQGDLAAYNASVFVTSTRSGSTSFLANPAGSIINGDMTAGADGVYLNSFEFALDDAGYDIAAIGPVVNFRRSNATGAKDATWIGFRPQSQGSVAIDAFYSCQGPTNYGIDLTPAILQSNKAAIIIKANDRVYGNGVSSTTTQYKPTSDGTEWFTYSSGLTAWSFVVGSSSILEISATRTKSNLPIGVPSYVVAGLPTGAAGDVAYASNGRKNGEGAGSGTGVLVFKDGTAWRACDTGATVAA